MTALRILVADDHDVVRHGLRSLLESHHEWEVCGEACNGREAVELTSTLQPEIVIADIAMPEMTGLEATREILKQNPKTQVIILTMHESEELLREVLDAGARGYVLKTDKGRELISAIDAVRNHNTFFTSKVAEMVLHGYLETRSTSLKPVASRTQSLTSREREVLTLVADGKSNKEVAVELKISVKTAEAHRINIMRKLNAHSVVDLVKYAMRNNMLQ
jgi:DNA-binding NarL/FixJ family response regulator